MKKEVQQHELHMTSYGRQATSPNKDAKTEPSVHKKRSEDLFLFERQIERLRYTISMKETELVLIFRELMSWDYYVPDHYFDMQLLMQN